MKGKRSRSGVCVVIRRGGAAGGLERCVWTQAGPGGWGGWGRGSGGGLVLDLTSSPVSAVTQHIQTKAAAGYLQKTLKIVIKGFITSLLLITDNQMNFCFEKVDFIL